MHSKKRKNKKLKLKRKFKIILYILLIVIILSLFNQNKDLRIETEKPLIEDKKTIYLALNDSYTIKTNYKNIEWISSDNSIVDIINGIIKPLKVGSARITAKLQEREENIEIEISDLYDKAKIDNEKDLLPCNEYSKEETEYLDKVLENKIKYVGYQTRAGAVAAARFLSLEFKYRIPYFYENGRLLTNGNRNYVDGEGRYYHAGLYLHESKFDGIKASKQGPEIWGCNMYTETLEIESPNGLDCSGFISWVLLNAGFDVGDAGAGIDEEIDNDLDDLGQKIKVTEEGLKKNSYKVGDLISRYGHIGIIIGINKDNIYVAEALDYDLHVNTYTKEELIESDWQYIILLDNLYKKDGKLTNMW